MGGAPEAIDAVPFTDDGLPKAFEEEEGGGGVGDLEEDICELRGQRLLDERLVGHPVTFFQGPISILVGDQVTRDGQAHSRRFPSIISLAPNRSTGHSPRNWRGTERGLSPPYLWSPFLHNSEHTKAQRKGSSNLKMREIFPEGGCHSQPCLCLWWKSGGPFEADQRA